MLKSPLGHLPRPPQREGERSSSLNSFSGRQGAHHLARQTGPLLLTFNYTVGRGCDFPHFRPSTDTSELRPRQSWAAEELGVAWLGSPRAAALRQKSCSGQSEKDLVTPRTTAQFCT